MKCFRFMHLLVLLTLSGTLLATGCASDTVVGERSSDTSDKAPQISADPVANLPSGTTAPQTTTLPVTTRPLPDFPLEEKIYFDADLLNDETLIWDSPCQIFVILQTRYSVKLHEYTVEDFPEIACTGVLNHNLSWWEDELRNTMNRIQHGIGEPLANNAVHRLKNFHQYLTITLETSDLNEMLEAIRLLEQREDVLYAKGTYYEPVILD